MNYRILLVEDDPGIASSLQAGLQREGYTVHVAAEGEQGLELARKLQPHLVILDVRLPDISGFDVCRQMRQSKLNQPIIMLTVQHEEVDKILGLEMGADDYVTKPFSLRELLSRIRAQLRRSYGDFALPESEILYIRDLIIDRQRGQVWRGDDLLHLTPTEFRLLTFMAQHPNQTLSRSQLLDAVWGYEVTLESDDLVKVNIRRLREKIELNPGQPTLLLTVPGLGYRLAVGVI